jgi:hypothetical protein
MKKGLFVLLLGVGLLLSGCASGEMDYEPAYYEGEGEYQDENTDLDDPDPIVNEPQEEGGNVEVDSAAPELENRKIIYTADLAIKVENPVQTYNTLLETIGAYTAYVETAGITTDRYELTIRVLSSEFDDFVEEITTSGEIVSYSKTSEDVTNAYSTFEARLSALETRHDRLLELIADATDLDTILQLEEERYEVEADLNAIGNILANYDSLVDYSTVTVLITKAVEEVVVLPRTTTPTISVEDVTKDSITVHVYNRSESNATIQIDVYQNGEFITQFEESTYAESMIETTFENLKSNKEYTFKVTAVAASERVSLEAVRETSTDPTYTNRVGEVFLGSLDLLGMIFEFTGLMITSIVPFAVTGGILYVPIHFWRKKRKRDRLVKDRINDRMKEQ